MSYREIMFPSNAMFLVTGAAGFIGSNLCEAILNKGCKVKALDDLSTGKQLNIDIFVNNPNYTFIKGDIKDLDTCIKACEGVDYVLHQAAWGSVPRSIEMPLFYCKNNIDGTLNMLEAARQNHVKKFIYASSSSVYGDEPNLPKTEGREGNLLSPYALTKRCDEEWAKLYTKLYGLDTYGMRYFNVFGRRQDPDGAYAAVIPKFIKQLLHGERPKINGDGKQSRDFTYIDDIIEGVIRVVDNIPIASVPAEIYNIGCGHPVQLMDFIHTLENTLGKKAQMIMLPMQKGDVYTTYADTSKLEQAIGYKAKTELKQGIEIFVAWYKSFCS